MDETLNASGGTEWSELAPRSALTGTVPRQHQHPRSAAFPRATRILGIEDLHFHDLRHGATSRLFERSYQIQEVAQFTLHRSWATRYTHLRPEQVVERTLGATHS